MFFSLVLFVGVIGAIVAEEVTPPPPMHGNYGGTKKERAEAAQKLLLAATPEQKAVFTDTDPLLIEGIKAFNITFSVQAQAYSILKASVSSDKPQCDSMANRRADEIINKSRDDLIACLATFRNKILVDGKGFMDIRDLPQQTIADLVNPLDDCFQAMKVSTTESLGHVLVDHLICTKKA